MICKRLLTEFA